ncbi:Transporter [Desulfamplus magnetovallimortis]|uniref:Transporter n=1 Tax=Desulfamplus magnetovallimortis TaxID=1246637 RepID=A0A1W1HGI4_9BACT|nr:TRAP transporter permease [Desulfamplus magnetovallimortis]SLM31492.1 Transporter [Desulfamplus magnetovallimortis]
MSLAETTQEKSPDIKISNQDADDFIDDSQIDTIIKKFDAESNFRNLGGITAKITGFLCIVLSLFHVYTAGFGLLNEVTHRTVHLTLVLGLVFLVFPRQKPKKMLTDWGFGIFFAIFYIFLTWQLTNRLADQFSPWGQTALIGMSIFIAITALPIRQLGGEGDKLSFADWPLAIAAGGFSLYLIVFFKEIFIINIGFPQLADYIMGLIAVMMVTEACRRVMGNTLPVIGAGALLYGLMGPFLPGVLAHRGYDIVRIVEHLYLGTEGIYGVAVGVVATYVFHFVLFGVMAQASGLGQLFIDLAMILAGKYSGGPAKVSVLSSAFFGMISGSPIANTATTGSFTIPMMKKNGFSPSFASAVEASASCGGQVTPPIMGASAFVMTEMLGVPYNEIILIAIIPALFHYLAIFSMVHLEARRLGLKGMAQEQIPQLMYVLKRSWHLMIPLTTMVTLLLMQFTPYLAAFWGIILTIICSYIPPIMHKLGIGDLDDSKTLTPKRIAEGLDEGARYALAIGAACACVGFILGMLTLTGMGFKFSGAVLELSSTAGTFLSGIIPFGLLSANGCTLFFGLIMVAVACIIMGAGIPTTPCYIILASIAGPALSDLGVPLIATHFFVFYYGVLADVTPPVALAAYAGAGIGGADPMETGMTAFRLSMGKALVPFMFVYAPSMLLIDFNWPEFSIAIISGILGVIALSVAYIGYFKTEVSLWGKTLLTVGGLLMVSSNIAIILTGTALVLSVLLPRLLGIGTHKTATNW